MDAVATVAALLILTATLTTGGAAAAGWPNGTYQGCPVVKVEVNGATVSSPVPGIIFNGSTLVPLRAIGEALGGQVGFDAPTYVATVDTSGSAGGAAGGGSASGSAPTSSLAELQAERDGLKGVLSGPAVTNRTVERITGTIHGARRATFLQDQCFSATAPDGEEFVIVDLELTNAGSEQVNVVFAGAPTIELVDSLGYRYLRDSWKSYTALDDPYINGYLHAGNSRRGEVAFIVPIGRIGLKLLFAFDDKKAGLLDVVTSP